MSVVFEISENYSYFLLILVEYFWVILLIYINILMQ